MPISGFFVSKGPKGATGLPLPCWELCRWYQTGPGLLFPPPMCVGRKVGTGQRAHRLRGLLLQHTCVLPCTSPRHPHRAGVGTRHLSPPTQQAAAGQQTRQLAEGMAGARGHAGPGSQQALLEPSSHLGMGCAASAPGFGERRPLPWPCSPRCPRSSSPGSRPARRR